MRSATLGTVIALTSFGLIWTPSRAAAQAARWHVTYRRTCEEVARPVATWDGEQIVACGQWFEARNGAFLGRAPSGALATFPDRSLLVQDYTRRGVSLHRESSTEAVAHDGGGIVQRIAVSPSGRFVATIEDSCPGTRLFVRRVEGPRQLLRRVRAHALSIADAERAALIVDDEGRATWSAASVSDRSYATIDTSSGDGTVRSSALAGGPYLHVALSSDGSTRAAVRRDGAVVVSRAGASDVAVSRADPSASVELALDWTGHRLAVRDRASLRVIDASAARPVPLLDEPVGGSPMVFARGDRLLLGGVALVALSPVAPRRWTRPAYTPRLPDGWERGDVRDGVLRFPSHAGSEWAADTGQIAAYAESEGGAMVTAVATDASELSRARGLSAWATAVVSRYEPYSPLEASSDRSRQPHRAYRDATGRRTVDMTIPADGCDPSFRWVRFVEMGDALLRVVVRIPLSMEREDQNVVRAAFLDGPFGPVVPDAGAGSSAGGRVRERARGSR